MKVFIKIGCIILASFLISNGIYFLIEKGRQKYLYHTYDHFNELLSHNTNYDIIMLGSSRTHLHDDPRIIDSITGMDSYNAGIEGASMMELNVVLNGYLEVHPAPKLLVLEVSMLSFGKEENELSNPTFYLNHLDNKAVYKTLNEYWKYSGFYKYLPLFRLSQFDDINKSYALKGFRGEREALHGHTYKGYAENSTDQISDTVTTNGADCQWVKYSEKGYMLLEKIVATCKAVNIPLVIVYSPEYKQLNYHCPDGKRVIDSIDGLCKKNNIPFLNYLGNPICGDHTMFANIGHLNIAGAEKFSAILANDIKNFLPVKRQQ